MGHGIQRRQLFATNDGGRNFVGEKFFFFAGPEAGEREDGFADPSIAKLFAFGGAGDAKPVGAGLFESLGDFRAAVAVAIAFDDAENFSRRSALFGFRIYEIADGMEIVSERVERDVGPDWAAVLIVRLFLSGHADSQFCPGPRHKAAATGISYFNS